MLTMVLSNEEEKIGMKGNWVKKVAVSMMCLAMVTGCGSNG